MSFNDNDLNKISSALADLSKKTDSKSSVFNKKEHDSKSRVAITKLFLHWFFCLIIFSFLFCFAYNYAIAGLNSIICINNPIRYLDISNTVSIVITALSSGLGFVIGYYFKSKD